MQTKLIIGIGNPDEEYQNTRHNIGFMFVDYVAKKLDANNFEFNKKLNSLTAKTKLGKFALILAKPQTYVNKSGESVKKLCSIFHIPYSILIVVHDDLDIEFGNSKNSFGKNSGGHKGIESIIKSIKTKNFWRVRFGVSTSNLKRARQQSDKKRDEFVRNYVLSKFSPSEQDQLKNIFKEGYEKLLSIIR